MNPHPPAIPVRATMKSTYKPISRLHGDDLPKLKRLKKAEFSNSTTSFCLFSRRTLANKKHAMRLLNVWHRQHSHTLDSLRKEQLQVYHVMCRVQREKRRVQREEHEQLRENIRRLFYRQRKRHLLRRVIAKFKENVQRKRAEREEIEGYGDSEGNNKEDRKSDVVQASVERFKRSLDLSKSKNDQSDNTHKGSNDTKGSSKQAIPCSISPDKVPTTAGNESKRKGSDPESTHLTVKRDGVKTKREQPEKIIEFTGSKLLARDNDQAKLSPPPSPVVTLETTNVQKVLPPTAPTITQTRKGKSPMAQRDPNNPLITQTDAITHVAGVNTPKKPSPLTVCSKQSLTTESEFRGNPDSKNPGVELSTGQSQKVLSAGHQLNYHNTPDYSHQVCFAGDLNENFIASAVIKETIMEANEAEYRCGQITPSDMSSSEDSAGARREPNLVKKLKKEKETRMQKRTEILDSETIIRYSRKPYQDVEPMYGQPKRFEFLPPSRKLNHEQEKLVRAEHQVELEQQVKIDKFFAELFRPKDEDSYKFSKKDDEAEKPKKATLSLAGVLSGVFSLQNPQLSDAPRGKQSLQDKFRRLQSCQYLRVYQPQGNSDVDTEKLTSWDAAEKSLKTGFDGFAINR